MAMAQSVARPLSRCGLSLGLLCGMAPPAWAGVAGTDSHVAEAAEAGESAASATPSRDFDIPAQPLMTALDSYASATHLSIVAPSEMVRDRMSAPVHGRLSADAALRQLLAGTGLIAERQDDGMAATYYLKEAAGRAAPRPGRTVLFGSPAYAALVQARIWQALCADARTVPGQYRTAFRFQIDPDGHLDHPRLFASTGDDSRDAAVLNVLGQVRVDPPPAALARQSVLMRLSPDDPAHPHRCEAVGSQLPATAQTGVGLPAAATTGAGAP
jgi:hypothetical protein